MRAGTKFGLGGLAAVAVGGLLAADGVRFGEVGLTEATNGLPGLVIDGLELVTRLGALPAVVLVAVVAAVLTDRGRLRMVLAVVLAGGVGWVASHLVEDVVERPRPRPAGAEVVVRDGVGGSGYPSTHVTVATASLSAAALATRRSPAGAVGVGVVVGAGRMAQGLHFPLDVVGGLGLGVATAVLVVQVVDRS